MKKYQDAIFIFATAKLIGWAAGILILGESMISPEGPKSLVGAMIFLAFEGIICSMLASKAARLINMIQYSIFWLAALWFFGLDNLSFYRTIPETLFILAATGFLIKDYVPEMKIFVARLKKEFRVERS